MFENVPGWLTEKVTELRSKINPKERATIYYAASGWTISWYLRKNIQDPKSDPFFEFPATDDDSEYHWHVHVNHAILVAETLFLLRSSTGFEEQRKRLLRMTMRAAFFEMMAAKQFLKNGFEIMARPETGKRGEDFDFAAKLRDATVNVEVTALTAKDFSEKTIANRLHDKLDQVPRDQPAILYCAIPEHWTTTVKVEWDELLERRAAQFFRDTRRYNAVIFWAEQRSAVKGGASYGLVRKPFRHPNPRSTFDVEFLFGGLHSDDVRRALSTGEGLEAIVRASEDSEFFRWVDFLVPPQ